MLADEDAVSLGVADVLAGAGALLVVAALVDESLLPPHAVRLRAINGHIVAMGRSGAPGGLR